MSKYKIFNDPIYGFINIPSVLIFNIIEHPYFQRLRRISQLGLSSYVYPGAHHTRFEHAIGAMHLMQKSIQVLKMKSVEISSQEEQALLIAILLHDIGHGPFSHTLEHSLVKGITHEEISLLFMQKLNIEFDDSLSLAIKIFKGEYKRNFFNQLISSQLDMDRLDYLARDSFYTGVNEGTINAERIISMLMVVDDNLVVEEKGIYSVEKFLVARRLMYWMVYLHKTGLVADFILTDIFKRAKELSSKGFFLECSPSLQVFLSAEDLRFNNETLNHFSNIDDHDIMMAIKGWMFHADKVLSDLCTSIVHRRFPKVMIQNATFSEQYIHEIEGKIIDELKVKSIDISYYVRQGYIENQAYSLNEESIQILYKSGVIKDITEASDHLNLKALTQPVVKHFIYYPK